MFGNVGSETGDVCSWSSILVTSSTGVGSDSGSGVGVVSGSVVFFRRLFVFFEGIGATTDVVAPGIVNVGI